MHARCRCRLLPELTPGRAMMWGTILAMWGTCAAVALTARQLDIHTAGAGGAGRGRGRMFPPAAAGGRPGLWAAPGGGRVLILPQVPAQALLLLTVPLPGLCRCCCRSFPTTEEAPARLKQLFAPVGAALDSWLTPLRGSLSVTAVAGDAMRQDAQQSQLVKRLRTTLLTGA